MSIVSRFVYGLVGVLMVLPSIISAENYEIDMDPKVAQVDAAVIPESTIALRDLFRNLFEDQAIYLHEATIAIQFNLPAAELLAVRNRLTQNIDTIINVIAGASAQPVPPETLNVLRQLFEDEVNQYFEYNYGVNNSQRENKALFELLYIAETIVDTLRSFNRAIPNGPTKLVFGQLIVVETTDVRAYANQQYLNAIQGYDEARSLARNLADLISKAF